MANRWGNHGKNDRLFSWAPKSGQMVTAAMKLKDTCSLEEKLLKSRDITLPTKVHPDKAMVFPVVVYGCESCTIKKAERWRTDVFELWCWRRLLRVPWTARRSNQSILKEISPEYSLEGLMLKLKLQYFGHLMQRTDTHWKRPWYWEGLKAGGEGDNRGRDDETASPIWWTRVWVWVLGVGDGQGSLACCSPWGLKELDTTEWLNWTDFNKIDDLPYFNTMF